MPAHEPEPALCVAVLADEAGTGADGTLAGVRASAERAGVAVYRLLVLVGANQVVAADADEVVTVPPVGRSYTQNVVLASTGAPVVAFLDAGDDVGMGWVPAVQAALAKGPALVAGRRDHPLVVDRGRALDAGGFDLTFGEGAAARAGERWELAARLTVAGHAAGRDDTIDVTRRGRSDDGPADIGRALGKAIRRHRNPKVAMRAVAAAATRGPRALAALVPAVLRKAEPLAPVVFLDRVPQAIATRIAGRTVTPFPASYRADPHFVYAVGDDEVLHLYIRPPDDLRRAVEARRELVGRPGVFGVPAVLAAESTADGEWVLEARVGGAEPDPAAAGEWLPAVLDWLAGVGSTPGRALADVPWWSDLTARVVDTTPVAARTKVEVAVARLATVASRPSHGDLQCKNLRLTDDGVAAIDWESCRLESIPGLDVFFVAALSGGTLDGGVLRQPGPAVTAALQRLGLDDDHGRDLAVVAAAIWAYDERQRLGEAGTRQEGSPFEDLLLRVAAHY
ncbi:MAG: hypothetical protein QOF60_1956 [Actinomycetota bacterium]|nr:hypothetical protein [Actinomycetota bacterium]